MSRSLFAACVAVSACLGASSAYADLPSRLGVDLGFGISGTPVLKTVMVTSSKLELAAPLTDESAFIAQWGFALSTAETSQPDTDTSYAAVANPLLGWAIRFGEGFVLTPSVTIPLSHLPRSAATMPIAAFTHESALGQRRGLDRWLWMPDRFALVVPASLVLWFDPLLIETHVKLAFLFDTQEETLSLVPREGLASNEDEALVLQGQIRVAARIVERLWAGVEFSAVYTPTSGGNNAELALKPELRYITGPYTHVDLSLTLNLDEPLGPSWEPGRFWALMIGTSFAF